jgi:hypothetical protein
MRVVLTGMSALMLCGCLARGNVDLLQARLRQQQEYVAEVERRAEVAQAELKRSQREAEQLRTELAQSGKRTAAAEQTESLVRASKLQINTLVSGGLNRDSSPGDDALVAFFSLVDDDGEAIKLPGNVEMTLLDPSLPEPNREVGRWVFSAEACRSKWTRGFTGSGYQFTVPLETPASHEQLVLNVKLTTSDNRVFDATQLVRVGAGAEAQAARIALPADGAEPLPLDDINDPPPPPAPAQNATAQDWADQVPTSKQPVTPVRDSTNWTKDAFPQRR